MKEDTNRQGPHSNDGPRVHLNQNVQGLKPSATLAVNERSDALKREGKEIFKFGLGQSPFPVPASVVKALQEHAHEKAYLPVMGLRELRDAVARYHNRKEGLSRTGDEVLVGPGSKELLFIAQLVYFGELVIPTPSWVSYAPQASIIGRPVRWIETKSEDDYQLTPEALEAACTDDPQRPRLLILNYPNNPSGSSYSAESLEGIAKIAREMGLVILSDEIYGELHHDANHISISRYYPEGTIISSGLSKWCGAGGWRLGTFLFPPTLRWLQEAMGAVASETFTSTSAPIQYAAIRAFEGGEDLEDYLAHSRRIIKALASRLVRRFEQADVRVVTPVGGFYLFLDFSAHGDTLAERDINTGRQLTHHLLEEVGVAILPGEDFGRPVDELTARLAYVNFDGTNALAASAETDANTPLPEDVLDRICSDAIEGVEQLCKWLGK